MASERDIKAQSMAALTSVLRLLECSKCEKTITGDVYMLSSCLHKYCGTCAGGFVGKHCVKCKEHARKKELKRDQISTTILEKLVNLKNVLSAVELEQGKSIALDAENHPPALKTSTKEGITAADLNKENLGDKPETGKSNTAAAIEEAQSKAADSDDLFADDELNENEVEDQVNQSDLNLPTLTPYAKGSRRGGDKAAVYRPAGQQRQSRGEKVYEYCDSDTDSLGCSHPPVLTPYGNPKSKSKKRRKSSGSKNDLKKKRESDMNSQELAQLQLSISPVKCSASNTPVNSLNSFSEPNSSSKNNSVTLTRGRRKSNSKKGNSLTPPHAEGGPSSPVMSTLSTSLNSTFNSSTSIDKRNSKGETQLHVACRNGQYDKVKQLLMAGADVNCQDYAGWTPLHEVITSSKVDPVMKLDIIKVLRQLGDCNVNIPGMANESALHEAASRGLKDIVEYLLSCSASPNVRNNAGLLPRDVATADDVIGLLEKTAPKLDDPVVLEIQLSKAVVYVDKPLESDSKLMDVLQNKMKLQITKKLGSDVTHMIFDTDESSQTTFSVNYLYGVAAGCWLISKTWVTTSEKHGEPLSPKRFELQGCMNKDFLNDAPSRSRINREKCNPGLLDGFCIYLYKNTGCDEIGKKDLINLIKAAGGTLINREPNPDTADPLEFPTRFHANNDHKLNFTSHIILYNDENEPPKNKKQNMEHFKVLKSKWVCDSLGNFKLMEPDPYF